MRIYSNTLLYWPITVHVSQSARIYNTKWLNYHLYRINQVNPIQLITHSPIELLQENYQYYSYNRYYRDKRLEVFGNTFQIVNIFNQELDFGKKTWCYIPEVAEVNDIIVIKPNINNRTSSVFNSLLYPLV